MAKVRKGEGLRIFFDLGSMLPLKICVVLAVVIFSVLHYLSGWSIPPFDATTGLAGLGYYPFLVGAYYGQFVLPVVILAGGLLGSWSLGKR